MAAKHIFHLAVAVVISGCSILPKAGPQAYVPALDPPPSGTLVEVAAKLTELHGAEHSSLLAVSNNRDALLWRLMLVDTAQTSIDMQYFNSSRKLRLSPS